MTSKYRWNEQCTCDAPCENVYHYLLEYMY